jgi:hypothetical protein
MMGRLTLIKAVLAAMPVHIFFQLLGTGYCRHGKYPARDNYSTRLVKRDLPKLPMGPPSRREEDTLHRLANYLLPQ